jgi:hypothetical protein
MGPRGMARRRGRRRGLIVGAAVGSAVSRHNARNNDDMQQQEYYPPEDTVDEVAELEKLAKLKQEGILTEDEFQAKKRQILNI